MPKCVVFFVPLGQMLATSTGWASLVSPMPSALFNPAFTLKLYNQGHKVYALGGRPIILIFLSLVQHVTLTN